MSDLISRSALLDIVEPRLKFLRNIYEDYDHYTDGYEECCERIEDAPAVDAVPVVRCKDCKFLYNEPDDYCCCLHKGLVKITPSSFCSYGERKE